MCVSSCAHALHADMCEKQAVVAQLFQKTGLSTSLMSQFGTVEILDDLFDHWGADIHSAEKIALVRMMQVR